MSEFFMPRHAAGFTLEHNDHKGDYLTVAEYIDPDAHPWMADMDWATPEDRAQAVATNELWAAQWYPDTPVGFYKIYAATFESLMKALREWEAKP